MLTRTAIFCMSVAAAAAGTHDDDYTYTVAKARKAVLVYCHTDCSQLFYSPPRPCCDVFEQAMRGDATALRRVFTERDLHSGDNESWGFTAWPLLHVVGDKRFAAFLHTLTAADRLGVFEQIFYEGSPYPEAIASGYFERKFPHVAGIYRKLSPHKASNQTLQPTRFFFFMTTTLPQITSRALARHG